MFYQRVNKSYLMKSHGMFIFRRDLRLDDNTGLLYALQNCKDIIPCFILDPKIMKIHQKSEMIPYRIITGS